MIWVRFLGEYETTEENGWQESSDGFSREYNECSVVHVGSCKVYETREQEIHEVEYTSENKQIVRDFCGEFEKKIKNANPKVDWSQNSLFGLERNLKQFLEGIVSNPHTGMCVNMFDDPALEVSHHVKGKNVNAIVHIHSGIQGRYITAVNACEDYSIGARELDKMEEGEVLDIILSTVEDWLGESLDTRYSWFE